MARRGTHTRDPHEHIHHGDLDSEDLISEEELYSKEHVVKKREAALKARHKVEDLQEEKRLHQEIDEFSEDWDSDLDEDSEKH